MEYEAMLMVVGHRNAYQFIFLALMFIAAAFPSMQILSPNFTMVARDTSCDSTAMNTESRSTYTSDNGSYCTLQVQEFNSSRRSAVPCTKWSFNDTPMITTVQEKFGLMCTRSYLVSIIQTVFMLGFLVGSTCYGILSDHWGRKNAFITASANVAAFGLVAALTDDLIVYMVFRCMTGFGAAGMLTVCYTWHTESLHSRYRFTLGLLMKNGWSFGIFLLTLAAWYTKQWKYTEILISVPAAVLLLYYAVLVESPRWLLSKNRIPAATKAFQKIAKINCKKEVFQMFIDEVTLKKNNEPVRASQVYDLFKTPNLRRVTVLVWLNYFIVSVCYYGLSLGWGTLGGNIYVVMIYAGCVEIASRTIGIIAGCFLGRTLIMFVSFGIGGVSLFLIVPFYQVENYETVVIGLALIGRFGLLLAFELMWLYSSEVFPTQVRNSAVGFGSTCARIGGVLSPLLATLSTLWPGLHLIIYSILSLTAATFCLFLPETKGQKYPDSMSDGEELCKRYRKFCLPYLLSLCCSQPVKSVEVEEGTTQSNVDSTATYTPMLRIQLALLTPENCVRSCSDNSLKDVSEVSDSSSVTRMATRGSDNMLDNLSEN